MQEHLDTLIHNDWIEPATGPWGSMIVLAPKPHQEHVTNITDFIWRLCISYRKLNAITLPFEYPIPRCDDAIDDFGEGHGRLHFISLDARSGYHQISVHPADRCKLAFFGPDGKKYTFKVMPFGPRNAPPVYTAMMRQFEDEWETLFDFRFPNANPRGCRVIVDDILLWSSNIPELLGYLECVLSICLQYRLSLKLSKCDFLKERIEYVGHDLTPVGNCPAESKFTLIDDWPIPTTVKSLHSFICLCNFYSRYCPWFEVTLKPFRTLVREQPSTATIPTTFWSPSTTALFHKLKQDITSSPCLARFDRHKPVFLKTDYSALGMALALMQPDDSDESKAAMLSLHENQDCDFDTTLKGARLRPIKFHSRRCLEREQHYHSFVGEAATGRWAIGICRKYLVGQHFFWLCDCSAMKEILEYTGNIHQVRRWSQELLGYHFTILHRPARMMQDVDALSRFYDPLIACYNLTANQLRSDDYAQRPHAFRRSLFPVFALNVSKYKPPPPPLCPPPTDTPQYRSPLFSIPWHRVPRSTQSNPVNHDSNPSFARSLVAAHVTRRHRHWLSYDSLTGTLANQVHDSFSPFGSMSITHLTSSKAATSVSAHLLLQPRTSPVTWCPLDKLPQFLIDHTNQLSHSTPTPTHTPRTTPLHFHPPCTPILLNSVASPDLFTTPCITPQQHYIDFPSSFIGADFTCHCNNLPDQSIWFTALCPTLTTLQSQYTIQCASILFLDTTNLSPTISTIHSQLIPSWTISTHHLISSQCGDNVAAFRLILVLTSEGNYESPEQTFQLTAPNPDDFDLPQLGHVVLPDYNDSRFSCCHLPSSISTPTVSPNNAAGLPYVFASYYDPSHANSPVHCAVYHPDFACPDPFSNSASPSALFGPLFGIPYTSTMGGTYVRPITLCEILTVFGVSKQIACRATQDNLCRTILLESFPCLTPPHLARLIAKAITQYILFPLTDTKDTTAENIPHCLLVATNSSRPIPSDKTWMSSMLADPDTTIMLEKLSTDPLYLWPEKDIQQVSAVYRPLLRTGCISFSRQRLIVTQPISPYQDSLILIIVPVSLRRDIFSAYHGSPTSGHFGTFKTLSRIRSRFIWPRCTSDVKLWVTSCSHCVAVRSNRRVSSELCFSWPITAPFSILHVDLWSPGAAVSTDGYTHVLGAMCDLTGFVILVPIKTILSSALAVVFMERVLLQIGFCHVVHVDADNKFKSVFEAMCKSLSLRFSTAAKGNHQSVSIERFFKYANKAVTIATQDRATLSVWVPAILLAAYAWNSSPIDGTDIIRSIPAVGRPFWFPLDLAITNADIDPVIHQAPAVVQYLLGVSSHVSFAQDILKLLVSDRRTARAEHVNSNRTPVTFDIGDLVLAQVQVQSHASHDSVAKLSYSIRGPFTIAARLQGGAYSLRKIGNPHGPLFKFPTEAIQPCPPGFLTCDPIDAPDLRYLNLDHIPTPNPLAKPFNLKLYNEVWFSHDVAPPPPKFDYTSQPDFLIDIPIDDRFPTMTELTTELPAIPSIPIEDTPTFATITPAHLAVAISTSLDKLFFICYLLPGTLRPRWYLVQVDMDCTAQDPLSQRFLTTGQYYVHFQRRHVDDTACSDLTSRWWPIWHEYTTGTDDIIDYGKSVNIRPHIIPDHSKYIAWCDVVPLTSPLCCLLGPFNFLPGSRHIHHDSWAQLFQCCAIRGIIPPTLSLQPVIRSKWSRQQPRHTKRKQTTQKPP